MHVKSIETFTRRIPVKVLQNNYVKIILAWTYGEFKRIYHDKIYIHKFIFNWCKNSNAFLKQTKY